MPDVILRVRIQSGVTESAFFFFILDKFAASIQISVWNIGHMERFRENLSQFDHGWVVLIPIRYI